MAFAPYTNDRRNLAQGTVLGSFRSTETDVLFEFAERTSFSAHGAWAPEFNTVMFVGPEGDQTRLCRVLKTRVHVVVDEDDNGNPVVVTWKIKQRRNYAA